MRRACPATLVTESVAAAPAAAPSSPVKASPAMRAVKMSVNAEFVFFSGSNSLITSWMMSSAC